MIGHVEVDQREYEIELIGTYATLRRLEPPGERPVRTAANELYDFPAGKWDVSEVTRVVRHAERQGGFDWPAIPEATPMIERVNVDERSYKLELVNQAVTFWRIKPEAGHSITVQDEDGHLAYSQLNAGVEIWSFDLDKVKSAIRLLERNELFDKTTPDAEINKLLSDNARYMDISQIINCLVIHGDDPRPSRNRVLDELIDECFYLAEHLGYL